MTYSEALAVVRGAMQPLDEDERLRLAQAIWEEVDPPAQHPELTDSQKAELRRRRDEHRANPSAGVSWEQVKAESRARRGRRNTA